MTMITNEYHYLIFQPKYSSLNSSCNMMYLRATLIFSVTFLAGVNAKRKSLKCWNRETASI